MIVDQFNCYIYGDIYLIDVYANYYGTYLNNGAYIIDTTLDNLKNYIKSIYEI